MHLREAERDRAARLRDGGVRPRKDRLKPGQRPARALAYLRSLPPGAWASVGDVARHLNCPAREAERALIRLAAGTPPLAVGDGRGKYRPAPAKEGGR
jgi:hypothetical protein